MEKTLGELAKIVEGRLAGDPTIVINGVNSIDTAVDGDITFAVDGHISEAEKCKASAIILPSTVNEFPLPAVFVDNPREVFIKLIKLFTPPLQIKRGISDKASIGANVTIGKNVAIMPFAVIDDNAVIGDDVILYPHVYIGQHVKIGSGTLLYSSVTVREFCEVGKNVIVHSSAVIGSDGFGFVTKNGKHIKVPQIGNVVIEDNVEIGAHTGIDRAAMGSTYIRRGTKIDNLVHIGHSCDIGENVLVVAQTGISGSTKVGNNVTFGGQTGVVGHINIGAGSVFAARSGVINNTPEGVFYAGFPARPHQEWLRIIAASVHLPQILKKIRKRQRLENTEK
ncbi:UDP-3-O-(3-hydroxymyristoyl)glucosamine N-acyltransferase [Pectinatus cerevisiiphilus]|uniref:UDP-3-O-acylglucosamine N-acyltransferase n=1 Tax=Pectinatus cerevisiiphilus TaxID=86956 RepID=A0A4R3KCW7_9FIRM|nr:UDP-3-O-(3-hydroxymyristoyl)glucosamine N-acyltransferase [Pectinatus cerevisiiphilus]TCS80491.1 UDP-3-O-[3-hydroxymyristoyl] glucosamine N-acyltransferase [Pectinatus cerevisiiphilus]